MFAIRVDCLGEHLDLLVKPWPSSVIDSWVSHFVGKGKVYQASLQNCIEVRPWDIPTMTGHLDIIRARLQDLSKEFGIQYDGLVPQNTKMLCRDFTNRCHRFFTERQLAVNQEDMPYGHKKLATSMLADINSAIHELELFLPPARHPTGIRKLEEIHIEFNHMTNQWESPDWWQIDDLSRSLHTRAEDHCDVILTSEILGKTLLRSYLDDDDPNHWDTTGHYCSLGGLQIQLEPLRRQVYQSADFQQWVSHKEGPLYFDFPIGEITNRDQLVRLKDRLEDSTLAGQKQVPVSYVAL